VEAAEDPATNGRTAIQRAAAIEALPVKPRIPTIPARLLPMKITLSDEALLGDLLAFLRAEGCIA
jgi:hypothetical protein